MTGTKVESAVDRVAEKVKRWRQEAGLSLQEVANRSGVSPSTIHKIEHRHTVPTIAVVLKLVNGLGRQAVDLFEDARRETAATHIRHAEQPEISGSGGARLRTLAGERDFRSMGIWRMVQPPGTEICCQPPGPDKGEIVLYLEEGQLSIEVDGIEYRVDEGDSLHFGLPYSYTWRNVGTVPAVVLVLTSTLDSVQPMLASQIQRFDEPTAKPESERRFPPANGMNPVPLGT
ncbi:MAG: XRE family transcriptional regulator [Myxococcota bacterium]